FHLRTLAHVGSEVTLEVTDLNQARSRNARGWTRSRPAIPCCAIRDHDTQQRWPFLRFFACEGDLSHEPPDAPLPDAVASGKEPFIIIGAIAGG
ncbi:MAG TPA: hypothetical protein VGV15_22270, partial [Terriglobales bacterium]|nr:hypothetical protein [Terriglobales bacterium]